MDGGYLWVEINNFLLKLDINICSNESCTSEKERNSLACKADISSWCFPKSWQY